MIFSVYYSIFQILDYQQENKTQMKQCYKYIRDLCSSVIKIVYYVLKADDNHIEKAMISDAKCGI